ncbi:MAG: c-type cytochrome [Acidimicrobiales bacterium]
MTEIPEHLLARSRARRAAAGLGGETTPSTGAELEVTSSAAPAPVAATTGPASPATQPAAAPPAPPPPPPTPPYVRAYDERKKIPFWVMPVLVALPLWLFIYANTLVKPSASAEGPLGKGKALFLTNCSSCHGAGGEGGVGPSFQNGAVVQTWPDFKDHIKWVHVGSAGWPGDTYGAQNKPKGSAVMPAFGGTLTDEEIALIVRYEREVLGHAAPEPDLVAISEGTSPALDKDGKPVAK